MSVPVFTPTARRDIQSIWRYISRNSVKYAELVEKAVFATCYSVAKMPGIGHRRPDLTNRDVLFVPVSGYERYAIAYLVGSEPLRILRVLHGARDMQRLFRS